MSRHVVHKVEVARPSLIFPHIDQANWMDLEVLDMNSLALNLYLSGIIKCSAAHFPALLILLKIKHHNSNRVIVGLGTAIEFPKLQRPITHSNDPAASGRFSRANKFEVIESDTTSQLDATAVVGLLPGL